MHATCKSIRPFIGAEDYDLSRAFYTDLGIEESVIDDRMSYFRINDQLGFYLQRYYVKDWINSSMIFVEVENIHEYYEELKQEKKFQLHSQASFDLRSFLVLTVNLWISRYQNLA